MTQNFITLNVLNIREMTNRKIIHLAALDTNNVVMVMAAMVVTQSIITFTLIAVDPDQDPLLDKKIQITIDAGQS